MGKTLYPIKKGDIIKDKWEILEIFSKFTTKKVLYVTIRCIDCGRVDTITKRNLYKRTRCETCDDIEQEEEILGRKYGMLTVLEALSERKDGSRMIICQCDCGKITKVKIHSLLSGRTISCGCQKIIYNQTKHGMSNTKLYGKYCRMKARCYSPDNNDYKDYGARGISVCPEWLDPETGFDKFKEWALENGYNEELQDKLQLTIERDNNQGNYCPENCCFKTMAEQQTNKRNTIRIMYKGHEFKTGSLSSLTGIPANTIRDKFHRGELTEDYIKTLYDQQMRDAYNEFQRIKNKTSDQQYFVPNEYIKLQNAIDVINHCRYNK